ncbi:MAG: hypothetical protein WCA08_12220 [Desulfoferrobacter sp.]
MVDSAAANLKFDRMSGNFALMADGNAVQIFVHDVVSFQEGTREAKTVCGREHDAEKALVVAGCNDVVCVRRPIPECYLHMLEQIGIGPDPQNIVVVEGVGADSSSETSLAGEIIANADMTKRILQKIADRPNVVISPYAVTSETWRLASLLETKLGRSILVSGGTPELFFNAAHKHLMKETAMELRIPIAEGELVKLVLDDYGRLPDLRPMQEAIGRQLRTSEKAIIKSSVGVLRSTVIQVRRNPQSIENALYEMEQLRHLRTFLVEMMYDVTESPNILMLVEPKKGAVHCVGMSDQRLGENLGHKGNKFPSTAQTLSDMVRDAYRFSFWLQSRGYWGIVGFDYGEYLDFETRKPSYFLAEVNLRVNASMYPFALMANLNRRQLEKGLPPLTAFISAKQVSTKKRSIAEFLKKFRRFLFQREKAAGVFPYSVAYLDQGLVDVVVFGRSPAQVESLHDAFQNALKE